MELRFLGTGSAFADTHNNAYFYKDDNLYIIDLSMLSFAKAKEKVINTVNRVYIFLTHLHSDHASGVGLMAQWLFYIKNKTPIIVLPEAISKDFLDDMEATGVERRLFKVVSISSKDNVSLLLNAEDQYDGDKADVLNDIRSTLIETIPTEHVPNLKGKCFGYKLHINKDIVYTGDTATLDNFIEKLNPDDEFYCEMSYYYGIVHLLWKECDNQLKKLSKTNDIYLMHLDDKDAMRKAISGTRIRLAST